MLLTLVLLAVAFAVGFSVLACLAVRTNDGVERPTYVLGSLVCGSGMAMTVRGILLDPDRASHFDAGLGHLGALLVVLLAPFHLWMLTSAWKSVGGAPEKRSYKDYIVLVWAAAQNALLLGCLLANGVAIYRAVVLGEGTATPFYTIAVTLASVSATVVLFAVDALFGDVAEKLSWRRRSRPDGHRSKPNG